VLVSTHGFFAPSELPSLWASTRGAQPAASERASPLPGQQPAMFHPGLLSGLALTGANTPPQPDRDDGILTAEEVASLNLSGVDLAVLSACETGLGEVAGGEGVLGLQRAFQVAGAATVVASLWKVDDQATRSLMERFCENLWTRKLGKLQALREAELWMIHEGPSRGLVIVDPEPQPGKPAHADPYYWAAFELSGDWR